MARRAPDLELRVPAGGKPLLAVGIGEQGYVSLHGLLGLGVLDRNHVLRYLHLHGEVLRLTSDPLGEKKLEALARERRGEGR